MSVGGDVRIVQNGLIPTARTTSGTPVALDVAVVDPAGNQLSGFDPSRPAGSTVTQVPVSATSVTLLAANAARKQYKIFNTSGNRDLYYIEGAGPPTVGNLFTGRIPPGTGIASAIDSYTGVITGIWSGAGSGNANVTETTLP